MQLRGAGKWDVHIIINNDGNGHREGQGSVCMPRVRVLVQQHCNKVGSSTVDL